ncbi:hypothetical protein AMS68_006822 [Peltaster fructicola]|uniref:Uncharacterized protein n=1 Tax=Peltaster fructicola TaxID=286661 RepID=A0A6H0Y310_9PEZI|nr:hypothetical protein AMS68_006822 [Peltaster fructicola]
MASSSPLLALPAELRLKIYTHILAPGNNAVTNDDDGSKSYAFDHALVLYRINRQIYQESRKVFRDLNAFVLIRTPWEQTMQYVVHRQQVPVVLSDGEIDKFHIANMTVTIDAPMYRQEESRASQFVIHLADLPRFTEQWFYSDLSYTINQNLSVELELHDPYTPDYEEKHVSKALQRKLLLPFGQVKRLSSSVIKGELRPFSSVTKELRDLQSAPLKSPDQCLREAEKAKLDGMAEMQAGHYQAALEQYKKAWLAMHIIVEGRTRQVYGDHYFGQILREDPYRGKNGQGVRMLLRVELVACTCLVYLKLKEYDECKFWGERSINMLRENIGMGEDDERQPEDEVMPSFPQFGRVYDHTAEACKALGERESEKLYLVVREYFPAERDRIDKAIAEC